MAHAQIKHAWMDPPAWFVIGTVACIIALESLLFLFPSPVEFPMDDAYIHFVYADNLVNRGGLFFNDPAETGIGTTSPLWVFLLAGLKWLGLSFHLSAKLLGSAMFLVLTVVIYLLLRPVWKAAYMLLAVFLVAISGNLLWFSLSGMETILFLALGALSLLAYRSGTWIRLGVTLGLMILARPEGILLAGAIGLGDVWAHRRVRREWMMALTICVVIAAPWFLYVYQRTGFLLPSSALGKLFTFNIGLNYIASQNAALAAFVFIRNLVYPFGWLTFVMLFALGGKSLPPPYLLNESGFGVGSYAPSVWAIPAWLFIVLPLTVAAARWMFVRRKWIDWAQDTNSFPLVIFALWILLHNLAYMLFIPVLGTASRYVAMNHIALWIVLAVGASQINQRSLHARLLAGGLIVLAFVNNLYWNRVYDANIEHIQLVRIQAGEYLRDFLPVGDYCAVFDIGAVRYYADRPILDISGLSNPEAIQWFDADKADAYMMEEGVTCLILPGKADLNSEGWIDFVKILGFDDSRHFTLEELRVFEMDTDRWLLGYLPTSNQQRSVVIYRIVPGK